MIIPKYWAEATATHKDAKGQLTRKRFGWSNDSGAAAQLMADERADEALQRSLSGEKLPRSEPKVPYNGADGVPIREEILDEVGDVIITRNSYGAHCMNIPNVLMLDIDYTDNFMAENNLLCYVLTLVGIAFILSGMIRGSYLLGALGLASVIVSAVLSNRRKHTRVKSKSERRSADELAAKERIQTFCDTHPDWQLALYATPAGLRAIALHRLFDPNEAAVTEVFNTLKVDPMYARMCQRQQCFRARLTGKPWRMGIGDHMKPRPGVWPVNPERLPTRNKWISIYETTQKAYASCRYIGSLGKGTTDPNAELIQQYHDEYCGARTNRPIA